MLTLYAQQALDDAVEHRHGKMRVPLITSIGSSMCVNDITLEEIKEALVEANEVHICVHTAHILIQRVRCTTGRTRSWA
jgi:hypothetical protein